MKLFDLVKSFLSKNEKSETVYADIPDGMCPNCWGREEYGGKFYEAVKNERIDLNNVNQKKGWIQAYASKHLEGIQLSENADGYSCKQCAVVYKTTN